jgi:membrane protein YdbS with pleckstrin-like domain
MSFHNEALDPAALPRWERVALTPVSRRLAPCHALSVIGRWALVAGLVWLFPAPAEELVRWKPAAAGGVLLLGLFLAGLGWVEARRRGYALREHDLIYRRGLLVQRSRVLPVARLQHVETLSNPLERGFGLVRLVCFTAGGRGADLVLEGLPAERAEAVKQHLLARVSGSPAPREDGDDAA